MTDLKSIPSANGQKISVNEQFVKNLIIELGLTQSSLLVFFKSKVKTVFLKKLTRCKPKKEYLLGSQIGLEQSRTI